jgi:hypothetical protein
MAELIKKNTITFNEYESFEKLEMKLLYNFDSIQENIINLFNKYKNISEKEFSNLHIESEEKIYLLFKENLKKENILTSIENDEILLKKMHEFYKNPLENYNKLILFLSNNIHENLENLEKY